MKTHTRLLLALLFSLVLIPPAAHAQTVQASGNVNPFPNPNPHANWDFHGENNLYVGNTGTGSLLISGGGTVDNAFFVSIGENAGVHGTVTVTGTNSLLHGQTSLYVGWEGKGWLTVADGGRVNSGTGGVGALGGSEGSVTVTGEGSMWNNSSALFVGQSGVGELLISDGGGVSNSGAYIGYNNGSAGSVTVTGEGSLWINSDFLFVGGSGNGGLQIANGGKVSNTTAYIGLNNDAQGNVTVAGEGSTWTTTGDLILGGSALNTATTATGTLTIADGGTVAVSTTTRVHGGGVIHIEEGGTLETQTLVSDGEVLVDGNLSATSGVTVNAGGIIGGGGEIDGNLSLLSGAKFQFDLHATLTVIGSVTLDSSFGIASLIGLDSSMAVGSYTLINGTSTDFSLWNIQNWGIENAYNLGEGKSAYFKQGSLQVEVVPEPSTVLLLLVGAAAILFSRRGAED